MELCKDPRLAAETALGPIEDFDFDIAILFSDLLFPLEAMGMGLRYDPGPILDRKLDGELMKSLRSPDEAISFLEFQKEAVIETRAKLGDDKSLIGFVGGPWTLFSYAVEGRHQGALQKTKKEFSLFDHFQKEFLMPLLKKNIQLQFDGGAEIVMVLDTAAGELSPDFFQNHLASYMTELATAFPNKLGFYTKGIAPAFYNSSNFEKDPWAGFGFDHRIDFKEVLVDQHLPGFRQGNFDHGLMFLAEKEFKAEVDRYLQGFLDLSIEERKNWVCGLSHGVLPETPEEHVRYFVNRVRELFK